MSKSMSAASSRRSRWVGCLSCTATDVDQPVERQHTGVVGHHQRGAGLGQVFNPADFNTEPRLVKHSQQRQKDSVVEVGVEAEFVNGVVAHHPLADELGGRADPLGEFGRGVIGRRNPFWRLLYEARLIPRPLGYEEDQRLAEFGIALTNLCARTDALGSRAHARRHRARPPHTRAKVRAAPSARRRVRRSECLPDVFSTSAERRSRRKTRDPRRRSCFRGSEPEWSQRELPGLSAQARLVQGPAPLRRTPRPLISPRALGYRLRCRTESRHSGWPTRSRRRSTEARGRRIRR